MVLSPPPPSVPFWRLSLVCTASLFSLSHSPLLPPPGCSLCALSLTSFFSLSTTTITVSRGSLPQHRLGSEVGRRSPAAAWTHMHVYTSCLFTHYKLVKNVIKGHTAVYMIGQLSTLRVRKGWRLPQAGGMNLWGMMTTRKPHQQLFFLCWISCFMSFVSWLSVKLEF